MKKFFMSRLAHAISAVTAESRIWRTIFALLVIAVGYLALTPTPPASIGVVRVGGAEDGDHPV